MGFFGTYLFDGIVSIKSLLASDVAAQRSFISWSLRFLCSRHTRGVPEAPASQLLARQSAISTVAPRQ